MDDSTISIVIPIYNEGTNLYKNITYVEQLLTKEGIDPWFILVNDGSRDNSWDEIKRVKADLGKVTGINLSRNFGKESALCAGLMEVDTRLCVVMDSDLQHPPEMIPKMLEKQREGYNIVECVKEDRGEEKFLYKMFAKSFYSILNKLSGFNMDNSSDFKVIDRDVIEAWKSVGDRNTFFRGMIEWVGFEKAQILFSVAERSGGETKFSTFGLIKLALTALTSFSSVPLYLTNFLSFIFLIGAIIIGVQTIYNKFLGHALDGFSTVILLILILGSAILFCLGIIGTYISKIYDEVKNRPRYIVKNKIK